MRLCPEKRRKKNLVHKGLTFVVNEASTLPTHPLAWSTELPVPVLKHVSSNWGLFEGSRQVRGILYINIQLNVVNIKVKRFLNSRPTPC